MINLIQDVLDSDEKSDLRQFANQLRTSESKYLLRNDILVCFF
jgi:sucrose synthase